MAANHERLLKSIADRNIEDLKECIRTKCSLTHTDWIGHSALHLAAINGDFEIANILLQNGANVNQQSKLNKTPLHFAAQNGRLDLARLFVVNGSFLNTLDILKMTPLHWAVERNHVEIVKFLCSLKKINLSQVDVFNRTCMVVANINGNEEILRVLETRLMAKDDNDVTQLEVDSMEEIFKSSSIQRRNSHGQAEPPNIDDIPGLKEFYKKKCFVKGSSSTSRLAKFTDVDKSGARTSELCASRFIQKEAALLAETSDDDDDDDDRNEFDDILEDAKKKRLSMSPMNKIDDTLKWIKSQSSGPDFSKFEFSLSEAGKLTLDYLNKNDPIREEKKLFLKLVKDLEDEEKSVQEKMSISGDSSSRCHDLADLEDILFP